MKTSQQTPERNSGIDLLRLLLSFCVIVLHILHYGGLRENADPSNPGFYLLWLIGIAIDCTVNCFAIISGFVAYNKTYKYSNIIRLYLTVLYHGVFLTILVQVFFPAEVSINNWMQAFFPVLSNEFWYFTAYFGLFFLQPLLILGMRAISKKYADTILLILVAVFTIIPTFAEEDVLSLHGGYSILWLIILFVVGLYLKKYYNTFRKNKAALMTIFAGSIAVTCLCAVIGLVYQAEVGMRFIEYCSPTIVLAAIAVVLLFSSMPVPKQLKAISFFCVPFGFSIYLIHEHPLIRRIMVTNKMTFVLQLPALLQPLAVMGIAMLIWLGAFILDYIRQRVFGFCRIDKFLQRIDERFSERLAE